MRSFIFTSYTEFADVSIWGHVAAPRVAVVLIGFCLRVASESLSPDLVSALPWESLLQLPQRTSLL